MRLSLIGMSGCGKTFWSKKLQKSGFKRFCCDDLIEEKLENELRAHGYSGIQEVAKWMGQPFDSQYNKTSKQYLNLEKEVMAKILTVLETYENAVIDTTGSVIYAGNNILNKLSSLTKVIYLETPSSVKHQMYQLYLQDPKPVFWGNSFKKRRGEANFEALVQCYPKLLAFRTKEYQKWADVKLGYSLLHNPNFTFAEFIGLVKNTSK